MLDLTHRGTLETLDIDPADLLRNDRQLTNEIGEAAQEHRFQAIRSASVTGVNDVVGVMPENLAGAVLLAELIQEWTTASDLP